LTIAAVAVAVVVLAFVLWQVISVGGQRSSASPALTPTAGTVSRAGSSETGEAAAGAPGPASADSTPAAEPTPTASEITANVKVLQPNYTVQEGDTLGKIAERSGNSVDTLQGLNKLPDRGKLSIGQKLIVPES